MQFVSKFSEKYHNICTSMSVSMETLVVLLSIFAKLESILCADLVPYLGQTGSQRFIYKDDEYTNIPLVKNFTFLGKTYSTVYINGNGIITFGRGSGSHNFRCDASGTSTPTISVFMADSINKPLEFSSTAQLLYRQDKNQASLETVTRDVEKAFPLLSQIHLNWMLVVTWYNTPPLSSTYQYLRNTFQAILTSDETHSFVLLYYNNLTWPTMSASMPPAQAGFFDKDNPENNYLIPGSCTYSLSNITNMSNIDIPGKFVFRVDKQIELPTVSRLCQQEKQFSNISRRVNFTPYVIPALGIKSLYVHGLTKLCVNYNIKNATCTFTSHDGSAQVLSTGKPIPGQLSMVCTKPDLNFQGTVYVNVTVVFSNNDKIRVHGHVFVLGEMGNTHFDLKGSVEYRKLNIYATGNISASDNPKFEEFLQASLQVPKLTSSSSIANFTGLELTSNQWSQFYEQKVILRNGTFETVFPAKTPSNEISFQKLNTVPRALALTKAIRFDNGNIYIVTEFVSNVVEPTLFFAKLETSNKLSTNVHDSSCVQWYENEPEPPTDVLTCPDHLQQAQNDWRFHLSTLSTTKGSFNPNNYYIFMQSTSSSSGAGSQCAYNRWGNLVLGSPYGSRLVRHSPNNENNYWNYYRNDIIPYMDCCLLSFEKDENCEQYFFAKREPVFEKRYTFPVPFAVTGASQITTVNGSTYLLNAGGTFWLAKQSNLVALQISVETYPTSGSEVTAHVIITSLVVMSKTENGQNSKVQVSANLTNGLLIWLDDQPLNIFHNEISNQTGFVNEFITLNHNHVNIQMNGTTEVTLSFSSGLSLKACTTPGNRSLDIIGTFPRELMTDIQGLVNAPDYSNASFEAVKQFAEIWRVSKSDLMFTPDLQQKVETSYNNSVTITRADILKNVPAPIRSFCNEKESCMVDYYLTNDTKFVQSSLRMFGKVQDLIAIYKINAGQVECKRPKELANGVILEGKHAFGLVGLTMHYQCKSGYSLKIMSSGIYKLYKSLVLVCIDNDWQVVGGTAIKTGKDQNANWKHLNSQHPLSTTNIECVLTKGTDFPELIEPDTNPLLTPKPEVITPRPSTKPKTTESAWKKSIEKKSVLATSQPSQEKIVYERSNSAGISILSITTTMLWVIVLGLVVYLYRERKLARHINYNAGEMHLLEMDAS